MISLDTFIKNCERDLVSKRSLSGQVLASFNDLSHKNKVLCKPIIEFIAQCSLDIGVGSGGNIFNPEEHYLVCRLIPLLFGLDTGSPTWSSYLLSQAVKATTSISGIGLSAIGIAFLEIFCEYDTPLNKVVYNFCIDFSREFTVNYRNRLDEFKPLALWESSDWPTNASMAFLRYGLAPLNTYHPKFILETMIALVRNEYFENFVNGTKWLFEDREFNVEFRKRLINRKLSENIESLILSNINSL